MVYVKKNLQNPSLRSPSRVTNSIRRPAHAPSQTGGAGKDRVLQPGDQQAAQEGRQVLGKVCVGPLGAVELEGLGVLLGLLGRGEAGRVLDARGLAGPRGEDEVEEVDEEG